MTRKQAVPATPEPSTAASQVARRKVTWLWRDRFPQGMISLVAGRPDQGKSLVVTLIASEISRKGAVIFSNREDPLAQVVRPRLEAAGADLDRVHFFTQTQLPDDLAALEAKIKKVNAKAVILDPVASHLSPSMFNDQDVRKALTPVGELASRTGCAFILVTHVVKYVSARAHPLTAIGGSGGGLTGAARAIYLFGTDPADRDQRAMVPVKFNLGPKPLSMTFEFDEIELLDDNEKVEMTVGRLVLVSDQEVISPLNVLSDGSTGAGANKSAEKREAAAEWLTIYLSQGAQAVKSLKEDAVQQGISWSTLRRAAEHDVETEHYRVRDAEGKQMTMWKLPDGHPALQPEDEDEPPVGTIEDLIAKADLDEEFKNLLGGDSDAS